VNQIIRRQNWRCQWLLIYIISSSLDEKKDQGLTIMNLTTMNIWRSDADMYCHPHTLMDCHFYAGSALGYASIGRRPYIICHIGK